MPRKLAPREVPLYDNSIYLRDDYDQPIRDDETDDEVDARTRVFDTIAKSPETVKRYFLAAMRRPRPSELNDVRREIAALPSRLSALLASMNSVDGQAEVTTRNTTPSEPDGPFGGCWVRWKGERHGVPKGIVYSLIAFMWSREGAGYGDLDGSVFDGLPDVQTVRARVSEANLYLSKIGVGWKLSANSRARVVTKK